MVATASEGAIIVCSKDATKSTLNRHTWKLTCAHTPAKNRINVHGKAVHGSLRVPMNLPDISVSILAWDHSNVQNVNALFHGPITCHCTWNDILVNHPSSRPQLRKTPPLSVKYFAKLSILGTYVIHVIMTVFIVLPSCLSGFSSFSRRSRKQPANTHDRHTYK